MVNFIKYSVIGLLNTIIHWVVFLIFYTLDFKQYLCNFFGFCFAVVFSYIINSEFNFNSIFSIKNFGLFFFLMGTLSFSIGWFAGNLDLFPFYTLLISSILSLFFGYFFSKYLVFKVSE